MQSDTPSKFEDGFGNIDRGGNIENGYCVVCADHFDDFFLFGTEKAHLGYPPISKAVADF